MLYLSCCFLLICCFHLSRVSAINQLTACEDDTWYRFKDEKCFKLINKILTHDEAQEFCRDKFGNEATLIKLETAEEHNFVAKMIFEDRQLVDNVWLGAVRKLDNPSEFIWEEDGTTIEYSRWNEASPSANLEKNCTQLTSRLSRLVDDDSTHLTVNSSKIEDGLWSDVSCLKSNFVACQKPQNWTIADLQKAFFGVRKNLVGLQAKFDASPEAHPRTCAEVQGTLTKQTIFPYGRLGQGVRVQCDFETEGGDWTIIQQRSSGPFDQFYLNWTNYEEGFGSADGNYWIGLKNMNALTKFSPKELRVDLEDWEGNRAFAKYRSFTVGSAIDSYTLRVSGYLGNAGDSLMYHNGKKFTTKDMDNDLDVGNCAVKSHGAWWFETCSYSNLNGYYYPNSSVPTINEGLNWQQWKGDHYSLKKVSMKIRDMQV